MKANELMIGDWVYGLYPNGKRYANPFCIAAVDIYPSNKSPRIVTMGGYGFQEEHLAPIPITPEILEKNGWENIDGMYLRLAIDGSQYIEWYSFMGRVGRYYKYKDGHEDIISCVDGIYYIHQLQHALRLFRVKKEITV